MAHPLKNVEPWKAAHGLKAHATQSFYAPLISKPKSLAAFKRQVGLDSSTASNKQAHTPAWLGSSMLLLQL
jgi:hypothetical protein